jgi:hypothetical protein
MFLGQVIQFGWDLLFRRRYLLTALQCVILQTLMK